MATTTRNSNYNRLPPHLPIGMAAILRRFTTSAAAPFAVLGDILEISPISRGDKIVDAFIQTVDLDSGAGHVCSLEAFKTGETPVTIIHQTTIGQTGGVARPASTPTNEDGIGWVCPGQDWQLRLIVDTASAGAQYGVVTVCVMITGHRDGDEPGGLVE